MNPQPQTLKGSYRLHTTPTPIHLTQSTITLHLTHTYTLTLQTTPNTPKIKFLQPKSSSINVCEQDQEIVELFEAVDQYQCSGGSIRFFGNGGVFFMRGRRKGVEGGDVGEVFLGDWEVQLVNLALEVSDKHFEFQGINNVRYNLSYTATKDGSISFQLQSQQQTPQKTKIDPSPATIDFDVIFINCLLRSTTFVPGEVSFKLYDKNMKMVARGTPYLV